MNVKKYIMTPAEFSENFLRYGFPFMVALTAIASIIRHMWLRAVMYILMIVFLRYVIKQVDHIKAIHEKMQ